MDNNSQCSFLSLPQEIRAQVYHEVGLSTGGRIELNSRYGRSHQADALRTVLALRSTCRDIHDQISIPLYSQNTFVIHQRGEGGLQALQNFRPASLFLLADLTVHMDCCIDISSSDCRPQSSAFLFIQGHYSNIHDMQELAKTRRDFEIDEWLRASRRMLAAVKPFNLKLSLSCDAIGEKIASRILAPFFETTTLADCSIRVCAKPKTEFSLMVREAAIHAMGKQPSEGSFPFMKLPLELRYKILEYTNLVTDLKEVEWRPGKGYWASTNSSCDTNFWVDSYRQFCRYQHSAYSTACHCWIPPVSLFLVSRAFRSEAEAVFFRQNRIIVHQSSDCRAVIGEEAPALGASTYLQHIVPPHVLPHIRFLEIVFPRFRYGFLKEWESAYQDWLNLIDYLKDKLNYQAVTVRVYFADVLASVEFGSQFASAELLESQIQDRLESYSRLLTPLSLLRLHGLQRLSVGVAAPDICDVCKPNERRRAFIAKIEAMERVVMGDAYDRAVLDKNDVRKSLWLRRWELDASHDHS